MLNYSVKLDPSKLTFEQKKSSAVTRSIPLSDRMSFLTTEATLRGYFSNNDLAQSQQGIQQLPLLTWPLLDFLNAVNTKSCRMIELGSGNSTLWFAQQFETVVSYETNAEWYSSLSEKIPSNVSLNLIEMSELMKAEFVFEDSDYLLIDFAGHRSKFIQNLLKQQDNLPNKIILDNSDWYRNGAALLREAGYMEIPFFGFKSGKTQLDCTSLFLNNIDTTELPFNRPEFTVLMPQNSWDNI